ncbi:hypothetical protein GQ53DRAFT_674754 [Thozetella sp. PMI_491]|nr:hypothetical protein GQ53DRAFT_674754 [Thozetella sp. PMI_491]
MDEQTCQQEPRSLSRPNKRIQRSRKGCLYCRRRKIKCDEQSPSCGECSRLGRRCDTTTPIFRQQNKWSFARDTSPRCPSPSASSTRRTTGSATTENSWVQIPPEVVFVNDGLQGEDPAQQHHADAEALDEPSQDTGRRTTASNTTTAGHDVSLEITEPPAVGRIDESEIGHPSGTSSNTPHEIREATTASRTDIGENRETSFFLRHFSETPGRWMDLFDLDCYYSRQVPVLARHNLLVKYAACAFAAKQLGQVHGNKAVRGGVANKLSGMERWPERGAIDFNWFGMKYYDKSILLLMQYISEGTHAHRDSYNRRYNDEIIVAATILSCYEFLTATAAGWSRHLDGTQSLLRLTNQDDLFQFQPSPRPSPVPLTPPKALRAAFWNFARQDFLASLITRKHTRLNLDDLGMWRAMGLLVDEIGFISLSNSSEASEGPPRDDMTSNTLVWLLCKTANFIATNSKAASNGDHSDIAADEDQQVTTWRALDIEITAWYNGLPDTFQPSARITLPDSSPPNLRWETWYANSMCASTMQSYHMARMLLLINRPAKLLLDCPPSYSPEAAAHRQDLLSVYRSMQTELRNHAIEICSIAQGRPDDSARVHMLQPLYFAGRCLTDTKDQEVVIELMNNIEKDLGWATEYRVKQLFQEWGT